MSDIGAGLRTYLGTKVGVTNLVSTRIYFDAGPQKPTLPLIVLSVIFEPGDAHLGGGSDIANSSVQVDCYAASRPGANALGEQVRLALHGYTGAMGSEKVLSCHLTNRFNDSDFPVAGENIWRHRNILEFSIWLEETAPTF